MSVSNPGIQAVPEIEPNEKEHRRKLARAINDIQSGKLRITTDFTLTANQSSSTITDSRLGYYSAIFWMPMTAHAATEAVSGNMYVAQSGLLKGSAVLNHTNASTTDRTFRFSFFSP